MKANMQIGKAGLTEGVIQRLQSIFKNNRDVRISVLKNSERGDMEKLAQEIASKLEGKYTWRVIGFTITMRRRRPAQK